MNKMILKSNLELHELCDGCERISFLSLCERYLEPTKLWGKIGGCAGRTHNLTVVKSDDFKLNPLKASKRGQKGGVK
jgi:hypothetical protein